MAAILVLFILCTYGLAYLVADAKIFGCSTQSYLDDPNDLDYIRGEGILNIRHHVLKFRFFRELFHCYFCMGVWCGCAVHLGLVFLSQENTDILNSYLLVGNSTYGAIVGCIIASCVGSTSCYMLDLIVQNLEKNVE